MGGESLNQKETSTISKAWRSTLPKKPNETRLVPAINNGIFRIRKSTYKKDNACPERFIDHVKELTLLKTHQMYQEMLHKQNEAQTASQYALVD